MSFDSINIYVRSPLSIFLWPGLFCLGLWLLSPIDFVYSGDDAAVFFSLCLPLVFALGLVLGFRRFRSSVVRFDLDARRVQRVVWVLSLLGFLGLVLRLVERVFIRAGGAITSDFMANRELMAAGGGSGALALLGGVLSTFLLLLPFYVMLLRRLGVKRWRYSCLMLLSGVYPVADILLQGSRSTLVMYVGACFAAVITLYQIRLRLRYIVLLLLMLVALGWSAGQLFVLRTEQMGLDPIVSMYTSGYAHFAPASGEVIDYLSSVGVDGIGGMVYAYVHVCQYLLHGFYEFLYISANVGEPTTHGLQSFYIPAKMAISMAGGGSAEDLLVSGVLRPGVYTTLFGPWVYDFGLYGSVLASLFFGFGAGAVARLLRRGSSAIFPIYIVVFGFLPFSFVVNLFVSGTGQYALLGVCFLSLLFSLRFFSLFCERS